MESQAHIISQVANYYNAMEKAQRELNIERENLENFLLSQGYVKDENVYVHPSYVDIRNNLKKTGGFLQFPSWAVVILPTYS